MNLDKELPSNFYEISKIKFIHNNFSHENEIISGIKTKTILTNADYTLWEFFNECIMFSNWPQMIFMSFFPKLGIIWNHHLS